MIKKPLMETIYEDPIGEARASQGDQQPASISQPSSINTSPVYSTAAHPLNGKLASAKLAVLIGTQTNHLIPRAMKADAMVPTSGQPSSLKAVFITSTSPQEEGVEKESRDTLDEGMKIESTPFTEEDDQVQRTVRVGAVEAHDLSVDNSLAIPSLKSPQGRKFHSWLSYFYTGRVSGASSPIHEPPLSSRTMEMDEKVDETAQMLSRRPTKGILKMPKSVGSMASLPPPVHKTVFLRQEEVQRLTAFTERHFGPSGPPSAPRREAVDKKERKAKLQWNFEATTYHETFGRNDYQRGGVEYVAKCLTPELAMMIKRELNEVKRDMHIHEESKHHTQFYVLR